MTASITDEYFQLTTTYKAKYGVQTIVLLQVGAFFEVYGLKHPKTKMITGSQIEQFAQICQLAISEKNVCVEQQHVVMAGFRDYTLEKYLQKLSENEYTAVVYTQTKDGKTVSRSLHAVYSAGTFIPYDNDSSQQITNNIMSIWLEKYQTITPVKNPTILCGVSVANIFTGKSELFEYQAPYYLNPTTFDELERCVSTYCPSEVVINTTTLSQDIIHTIVQYVGLQNAVVHKHFAQDESTVRCTQQKYIHQLLATFFGAESLEICAEFQNNEIATQSFCYLLHFIQEHNPDLVRKIEMPIFANTSQKMLLANHTLKQLNIIDDLSNSGKRAGQYSSVLAFLNKCSSPMGKRRFQQQLISPTYDQEWLRCEYDITEHMLQPDNFHFIPMLRKQLATVRDIEKIARQIVLRKIYPSSIYALYESLKTIQQIYVCFAESPKILAYIRSDKSVDKSPDIFTITQNVIKTMDESLQISRCQNVQSVQTFEASIIQPGVSPSLDLTIAKYDENLAHFNEIHTLFNKWMKSKEGGDAEYVKIHTTEKSGMSLQITKKRAITLKSLLKNITDPRIQLSGGLYFSIEDVRFVSASTSTDEIDIPCLKNICKSLLICSEQMNQEIAASYQVFLTNFENTHLAHLEMCADFVAKMDVLHCKAYIANSYNYCKPILTESPQSFVDARDLRHVLIEHLQTNEIYVANDISLQRSGILLYGTNAVGKTSFIRALGISIIMAQSGLYVPCSQFSYCPYRSIFSRILGNDNLFKGLSTFAVEMSELRMILRSADDFSLILGDELCSGTETESALSIFMAGLLDLHEEGASFIFATHFHEIMNYDEMQQLERVAIKHMAVRYDREMDCLIYDRKLQDGPGNRMYGLEVCKSLYLPEDFLTRAMAIRNKYHPTSRGELAHTTSTYNAQKIRGICEMCNTQIGEEIHHLQPQKEANDKGFIGSIHMNHPANLMTLCESCHTKTHQTNLSMKRTKTTKGYIHLAGTVGTAAVGNVGKGELGQLP